MKKTNHEKFEEEVAKQNAARMLLKDYIQKNPDEIARAIEKIIPFFYECPVEGLQRAMNTVNATFAVVALDVIKSCAEEDDDCSKNYLPVDAEDMKTAIYYLSRFINQFDILSHIARKNDPAINMCRDVFSKIDIIGC